MITAGEDVNREALRQLFMRHNLQMIPIVDSKGRIKAVVTKDKIIDIV